jgi:predicted ferric reductase
VKNALTGVLWVAVYLVLVLAPLAVVALAHPPAGRPFLVEFSVALGFVGLALMGLQFGLIARSKPMAAPFGIDALTLFHKQMSYVALAFILAHPLLLFFQDSAKYVPLLNVSTAPWRARFAVSSVLLLLALMAASLWRKRLRLSYEFWQVTHGVLAVAVVVLALVHIEGVGYYVSGEVKRILFWIWGGGLIAVLVWIRVGKPLIRIRHPWRLAAVRPERGDATTMVIEPVGHAGFAFQPGQFGWVIVGRSAFARAHHPFSFSTSAAASRPKSVALTIKATGDFTNSVAAFLIGTRVYLDGPHGVFSMDLQEVPGYVFIGGGFGIMPLYSMLVTMLEREDVRPVILLYASRSWDEVIFREQLDELSAAMPNLTVVYVLEHPHDAWAGETGRIDAEIVTRHVSELQLQRYQYFVCGAPAMLDAMERLLVSIGVPAAHFNAERFDFVLGGRRVLRQAWVPRLILLIAALLLACCLIFAAAR